MIGMKNIKPMKNYLIPLFCLFVSTCFGDDKTVNIQEGTTNIQIDTALNGLDNNGTIKLTITSDPNMEKTWYTLNKLINKTGIKLELTAKDAVLNDTNIAYLGECLLSVKDYITLTKLNVSNNKVTIGGCEFQQFIAHSLDLTEVNISGNTGPFSASILANLQTSKLTKIEAAGCSLKVSSFGRILNLNPGITTLDLSNNKFDKLTKEFSEGLQKNAITTLNLSGNANLFKTPLTATYLLNGVEGKPAKVTVTLAGTNASEFIQNLLTRDTEKLKITFL